MSTPPSPPFGLDQLIASLSERLVAASARRAKTVLAVAGALTIVAGVYAALFLGVNSDTRAMLSEDLPFRQMTQRLLESFPGLAEPMIVVVDADTPERAREVTAALAEELLNYPDLFRTVFAPGVGTFFDIHGLLYVDTPTLEVFSDRVISALPLVGSLARDPTLASLVSIVEKALTTHDPGRLTATRVPEMLEAVATILEAPLDRDGASFSWRRWVLGNDETVARQVLLAEPVLAYTELKAARRPIAAVRASVAKLGYDDDPSISVRVTGNAALGTEEMDIVVQQTGILSVLVSIAVVAGLLWIALGSVTLVMGAVLTLLAGLVWTTGFAALAIGHLNLVSTAFAVLFIGLGVDFGIHLSLRYRDLFTATAAGVRADTQQALHDAGREVGGSIALCAATTAIGFFAFVPTRYEGVAELGLISGVGMFLSLLATLTVLPAFLTVVPHGTMRPTGDSLASKILGELSVFASRRSGAIVAVSVLLAAVAITKLPEVHFDPDPVRVRDPGSESVRAMTDLLRESPVAPWSAEIVVPNLEVAQELADRLRSLDTVSRVVTLQSFVPEDQQDKLDVLEDLSFFLEPALHDAKEATTPTTAAEADTAMLSLEGVIASELRLIAETDDTAADNTVPGSAVSDSGNIGSAQNAEYRVGLRRLAAVLAKLRTEITTSANPDERTQELESSLFGEVPRWLESLDEALHPEPVTIAGLPESIVRRYQASDGRARVEVFPAADVSAHGALEEFVTSVQAIAPTSAGSAVEIIESGRAIVHALKSAFTGTLMIIALLLLLLWRSLRDTLLVLSALGLAAVLTASTTVLLDVPFNFADVIVLPLLLGVGVDSGIHLLQRYRSGDHDGVLLTSTARGVLFSSLTTIASFGTLAFSTHRGMASLGLLLTVGLGYVLFANLVFLPALLHLLERVGAKPQASAP